MDPLPADWGDINDPCHVLVASFGAVTDKLADPGHDSDPDHAGEAGVVVSYEPLALVSGSSRLRV